ncbi:helicase domino isoform X2 [Dendroctonus ponderosae]|uniref:helicase domino isoform X2 n=1 Tax=Dendroctonus ponderosae TaxID=77166 RepID=UPI002035CF41|nr:helicase domino isoform X2 [Dendroctonus ponderosae]
MSDDTPGAGQGALHPREGQNLRNTTAAERPTMRLTQVAGGQYVLTTQQHGVPALAQLSPGNVQQGVTRIINISPSRGQTSPLRPSVSNQSIVNVLTNRATPNARLQVFANNGGVVPSTSSGVTTPIHSRMAKRPLSSTPEKKDSYAVKLQRVTNHRIVKSKLLKEKYAENLLELFYLETGGNILDLYQYAKRPKTSDYVAYLKEHAIDAEEYLNYSICIPYTTPSTPTATSASSLPGSSFNSTQSTTPVIYTPSSPASVVSDNLSSIRMSTTSNSTICTSQEQIVEKAKQEAYVVQRVNELQKEGLWSEKRLPKIQEMPRCKAHWDYLLEEMVWLAADFAQERKWKKAAAKKCARMVQKYFQDKSLAALKAAKAQEQHLRRIASFCAKEVKLFWCNVEKLVEYKQNTILEEKRKRALDQQLSFIVDQTEKYSQLLAEGMNKSAVDLPSAKVSGQSALKHQSDDEFDPHEQSEEDDEETIAQEEAALGNFDQSAEVEALQRESQLELDDLLEDDFLKDYLLNRDNIRLSGSDDSDMESEEKKSKKSDPESAGSRKSSNKAASEKESKSDSSESDDDLDSDDESNSEELTNSQVENQSLKLLMGDLKTEGERAKTDEKDALINDAAAIAESIQPKGNTLSSTTVSTKVPFLLKLPLREYQHIGLEWLVTMYDRKLNGILADEMGLGKTIQTIALLAHLACEKENWGPHLIVVPTSVMLNWEMECKKWCPAFKILTYYGSQKERKMKRTGWTKPNMFHICITSYKLVIQDHQSFRRKKWKYLILDEAQNIKNFKSQRWQLLLNFQTERRLLLTGTPLQNNLMELWSLMHFLMPNVFQSHREFKEWFSNPVTGMIEGNSEYNESIIKRLHKVLRPFLLRRLKSEVEKQMPKKYEHVVMCRLSKRQRFLYDDYMSRANTRETLASGNLLSVINVLMQLRKVCNHPNLFEVRPTISPFQCENIEMHVPSIVYSAINYDVFKNVDLYALNLVLIMLEMHLGAYQCYRLRQSWKKALHLDQASSQQPLCPPCKLSMKVKVRDIKQENKEMVVQARNVSNAQPNVKMKVAGLQVLSQGVVKTVPLINISQAAGGQVQLGTPINVSSVLKPSDKVPTSFAQLVQTSTGKHLLLTSNPNRTGSVPVSQATAGGQKLTFLSTKQPIVTNVNTPQAITKAFVKFQLTSVTTGTTTTSSNSTATARVGEDGMRSVNSNFLGQLYSKQNNLDVRWRKDDNRRISNQVQDDTKNEYKRRLQLMARINERRCSALPLYGRDFQDVIKIYQPNTTNSWNGGHIHCLNVLFDKNCEDTSSFLKDALYSPERRIEELKEISDRFIFYVPAVKTKEPEIRVWHPPPSEYWARFEEKRLIKYLFSKPATPLHHIASAMVTQFPDPRLIQYDCGKLQTLDKLLRHLKTDSHRVLIFTQMTKMLDVLEAFLNFHGYIYLRLDGTTKVDQRQVLMERFNGDKRIFAFILSTRSGGVGVNLTGADTVVFYDSDWNPTMDAQAQDRCHRIGQTRDVHIYRLVSERTIEENILKKANQKRLLGDLAIEGGNFTTAYFKSTTIQDLFNIDQTLETAAQRMSEIVENSREVSATPIDTAVVQSEDKSAAGALETALAACEDDQDVQAAKIAKAEAVADLAEFDENIPLEQDSEREPEVVSKAEQEINNIIKKLSPIEKYAMKFIEQTESAWSAEQLAAAARQIEEQKREWEEQQMAAMREEEERRQRELEEENDMITYSREDATNQVWVSENTLELMPMWCPPTPPQQDDDVYIDQTMAFLYEDTVMSETQLPPIYVKKEFKRRLDPSYNVDYRRPIKVPRRDESVVSPPKSLFHSSTLLKLRRDMKLQKYRSLRPPSVVIPCKTSTKPVDPAVIHSWTIHEDMALLKVIKILQGLPTNLIVTYAAQTPNWDFAADYVNSVALVYRSPKQCKQRYEGHLMNREEGKYSTLESLIKKKKKSPTLQKIPLTNKSRPSPRTSQLYTQDNNSTFCQMVADSFTALKSLAIKRLPTTRTVVNNPLMNKTKNTPVLNECGIDLEHPLLPFEIAAKRAERIAKEKKALTPEQLAKLQMLKAVSQQQQAQGAVSSSGSATSQSASGITTVVTVPTTHVIVTSQAPIVVTTSATIVTPSPGAPLSGRPQRIIASPLQTSTVVSVSGLSPAQLQAATQRLIVTGGAAKAVTSATGAQGKQFSPAQLQMIRQAASLKNNQFRLHANSLAQASKASTVTIAGQQAVVQFSQAQPRGQFVRQGTVTVGGKTGVSRTVTDSEVAQLLKKQQQLQQQKMTSGTISQPSNASGGNTIHGLTTQVFAQAIQQAGTPGAQVATLVKAVPSSGGKFTVLAATQTVTIPVSGVTLAASGAKAIAPSLKPTTAQQLRHMQIQQQLMAQKKLAAAAAASGQKLSITTSGSKGSGVQTTQLIVGAKQAMTVQQFQQVIRTPINVGQGPVVLTKGSTSRVIPVNAGQGTKQTIQVVAASSQALSSALRPQGSTTIAGIKLQSAGNSSQQALLSQVTAALNQNAVRQNSPVRLQTASGQPIVAATGQSSTLNAQSQSHNVEQQE